jgi:phenylacetate-CoA ligase
MDQPHTGGGQLPISRIRFFILRWKPCCRLFLAYQCVSLSLQHGSVHGLKLKRRVCRSELLEQACSTWCAIVLLVPDPALLAATGGTQFHPDPALDPPQEQAHMNSSLCRGPFFGRLLLSLTCRLRGFDTLQQLAEIEGAPFLLREKIRENQFKQLSDLLQHAESHVPYYREMFRGLGIASRDIRDFSDFSRLPVLTKDIIRERQRDLVRDDAPLASLEPHFSGGSTGVPLKFYRSRKYIAASDAGTYRNLQQCGWRPGEMIAFFWGSTDKLDRMPRWEFELRQHLRRSYLFDPFRSGEAEMAAWAQRMRSLRPTVILGYASTIARFATFLESRRQPSMPMRGVFTTAEKLYQPQREVIERVFHCHVFDCYGSSEVQNISAECPQGKMHICSDYAVLEEDKDTEGKYAEGTFAENKLEQQTSQRDAPRPFLLTSLKNWSMPFIRYRNEDCGFLSSELCSCGNNFPLMRLEIARTSDNFIFPDGRVVHGEYFTHLMYGSQGIANFQFHQTAVDRIMLLIVPGSGDQQGRQQQVRKAVDHIQSLCPMHPIHIEVRELDSIPLSSGGKHRFTRSDVQVQPTSREAVPASN